MIQLFPPANHDHPSDADAPDPRVDDVDLAIAAEARHHEDGRPWLFTNMVASLDGGTAIGGVSGGLGNDGDRAVFAALRSAADVILVGSSTAREENYRPPRRPEAARRRRLAEGRTPDPRLVVVSASLSLPSDLPLFGDPELRPIILTCASAPEAERARLNQMADLLVAGTDTVELAAGLAELGRLGHRAVLSEGGPSLNGQLVAAGLVDEWNLTISPRLLAGDSRRAAVGPLADGPPPAMHLARVWADDDHLFCRWIRPESAT
jgi:riboflavin biosynthesis pyrimidine reductase